MRQELSLNLMDTHAGGDVSRIVLGGIDPLPGKTVRQQMEYLRDEPTACAGFYWRSPTAFRKCRWI
jgi:proline racemase